MTALSTVETDNARPEYPSERWTCQPVLPMAAFRQTVSATLKSLRRERDSTLAVMKTVLMIAILIAFSSAKSTAQSSDLIGTWTGEAIIALESEGEIKEVPRTLSIVIDEVNGSLVQGYRTWAAKTDDPGYVLNQEVLQAKEPFLGAISTDGVTLHLVEIEDRGLIFGRRLGPDQIEITYMEAAPHAVVYNAIHHRQK